MTRSLLPSEQLHAMAEAFGDETAYTVVGGGSMTFSEWDTTATQLAHGLVDAGVKPGDRVALHLLASNALRWMAGYSAVHRAGGVAVPFNPQLAPPEVARMTAHSDASAAFVERSLLDRHGPGRPGVIVEVPTAGEDIARAGGVVGWSDAPGTDSDYFQVPRDRGELADILYTSGTTGNPKAVAVRHENSSLVPFRTPNWSGGSWLHASPPYTFAGIAFVLTPMRLGLRGIYLASFDAGVWLDTVERERPGSVFLVPAMAALLLEHPRFDEAELGSVELCSIGSAPLAPAVLERLQAKLPGALVSNNYGMTEAGSVYCMMPPGEAVRRPGSVGQPLPPAEIICAGPDGEPVAADEIGEVRMRIPGRPREYYGDPEATAKTWVDGWLHTGDLGRIDEDGYLYIVGRSKDVIIRGGNNIHPVDVEHAIALHPAVQEVTVLGVPHPVLGEDVVACVVLRPGGAADADSLREHTLEHLARSKVPRRWYFLESLPRNATGKVVTSELRQMINDGTVVAVDAAGSTSGADR